MGIFGIPSKFFKKEKSQQSNYLSLVIAPDRVLATIWGFENEQITTLGFGQKTFENADVLIHEAAIAIDTAGKQAKVDISDVVFGLSEYYLEDSSLSASSTKMLKKLSQELELNPQAFVSLPAGINHLLKIEESVTPNAILVGIFDNFCEVHLLEGDKVAVTKSFKDSVNGEKTKKLIESLKDKNQNLPARIVIYGLNESSSTAEEINKTDWKDLFVHEPKIDFLDDAELGRSIAYAQGADILGHDPDNKAKKAAAVATSVSEEIKEETGSPKEANELGFIENEDILLSKKTPKEKDQKVKDTENKEAETIESNVETPKEHTPASLKSNEEYAVETSSSNISTQDEPPKKPRNLSLSFLKLPSFKIPKKRPGKKTFIALAVLVIAIIVGVFVAGQTLASAQVIIKVNSQSFEKDFEVSARENASLNIENFQIGASQISAKAQGNQKTVASGSKSVGESAKGEITVFNWTNSSTTFDSGTGIISKSGIQFSLDDSVEIASRSASAPGQSKANITAQEFGSSANLDAGNQFTFQEFDEISYSAQNDAPITGGSERQITIVTQEDMDRLEELLLKTLTEQARDSLKNKSAGEQILDDAIIIKVLNKAFDKNADEEASIVNLDLEVEASTLIYNEKDLKNLLAQTNQNETPNNLTIRAENIQIKEIFASTSEEGLILDGEFKADLVPRFDEEGLKNNISGKSIKEARAKIKELPGVTDVEVNFSPNIPFISSIPRSGDKISFKIETN